MYIDHRNPRVRRGFAFVALAAVLGLSAVGLTQCRMVDDTVTGVDVRSTDSFKSRGRSRCVHQCFSKYKKCLKEEDSLHKKNRRACDRLPHGQRLACRKAEDTRHKNALKECTRQYLLCKKNCRYGEGAGTAGR